MGRATSHIHLSGELLSMLTMQQLILVWSPGQGSPIHDHANAHCLMKVLKGSLKEIRYKYPLDGITSQPQVIMENAYDSNQVTYMADELGLHKISNPDAENVAVSLHRMFLSIIMYVLKQTKLTTRQSTLYQTLPKKDASFTTRRLVRNHMSLKATSTRCMERRSNRFSR